MYEHDSDLTMKQNMIPSSTRNLAYLWFLRQPFRLLIEAWPGVMNIIVKHCFWVHNHLLTLKRAAK